MAAWSTLLRPGGQLFAKTRSCFLPKIANNNALINATQTRLSNTMVIEASRWQWHKTKDMLHYYTMIAAIPLTILTIFINIFIGPATLTPLPEDYEPKYWEYYKHPITRFEARYIFNNPQKDYEKNMHVLRVESEIIELRKLEKKIWQLQADRQDYKYNHFLPYDPFASRQFREMVKRDRDSME